MSNENTTARPWSFKHLDEGTLIEGKDTFTFVADFPNSDQGQIDAEYAVKAVNAYDALKAKADMAIIALKVIELEIESKNSDDIYKYVVEVLADLETQAKEQKMNNTKHTAIPWVYFDDCNSIKSVANYEKLDGRKAFNIAKIPTGGSNGKPISSDEITANAKHIVHCVNTAEAKDKRIALLEGALEEQRELNFELKRQVSNKTDAMAAYALRIEGLTVGWSKHREQEEAQADTISALDGALYHIHETYKDSDLTNYREFKYILNKIKSTLLANKGASESNEVQ